jgi:hypothetical protein
MRRSQCDQDKGVCAPSQEFGLGPDARDGTQEADTHSHMLQLAA